MRLYIVYLIKTVCLCYYYMVEENINMNILIINGPNLNLLGVREPTIYGTLTIEKLEQEIKKYGKRLGLNVDCFQTNNEGEIIDKLHWAMERFDAIVLNAGAYTHYSYALRDAIVAIDTPVIE